VNAQPPCTATRLLRNPGFERGDVDWVTTRDVILNNWEAAGYEVAEAGSWFAWLDGYSVPHTDILAQTVTVPGGCTNYTLSYYQHIDTSERSSLCNGCDTLKLQVLNSSGALLATLSTYTNLNAAWGYHPISVNLAACAGQQITLKGSGTETNRGRGTTDFCIDTTAFNVSNDASAPSTPAVLIERPLQSQPTSARTAERRRVGGAPVRPARDTAFIGDAAVQYPTSGLAEALIRGYESLREHGGFQ
jgi:hypothetical protein